jgi:hypothetical protein
MLCPYTSIIIIIYSFVPNFIKLRPNRIYVLFLTVPFVFYGLLLSTLSISESTILGTEDESDSESEEELEVPDVSELLELSDRLRGFMDTDSESLWGNADNDRLESLGDPMDNDPLASLGGSWVIDTLDPDSVLKSTYS